ncbi:MAG: alpha/beta fold hydrolase [Pseudomonadota bacterium]
MSSRPATFVLVHGAWHGGWCWRDVAAILRSHGHHVTTPTLTGLGERVHLLTPQTDLATHVGDIEEHILHEDVRDIVLVGHSYAGAVIIGVADRLRDRIARMIFLDAAILYSGETLADQVPRDAMQKRLEEAKQSSSGLTMPAPPASAFGVQRPERIRWLEDNLTPHPIRTYLSSLHLQNQPTNGLPVDYVACIKPSYDTLQMSRDRAHEAGWPIHSLDTGHDALVTAPSPTVAMLEQLSVG